MRSKQRRRVTTIATCRIQFRRQAQKRINLTKERLNAKHFDSYAKLLDAVCYQTIRLMQQMGVIDKKRNPTNKYTQQEADSIFDIYYNAYLDRAKKNEPDVGPMHIMNQLNNK